MIGSYVNLSKTGELEQRRKTAFKFLEKCSVCPRNCSVNRLKNEKGFCQTGRRVKVSSFCPHHGEEPPISGHKGSGTIFFSYCNLACIFCQNYEISHQGEGDETDPRELADMMIKLQERGCHNINFVSPSHIIPQILEALVIAAEEGLTLPLVYNSNGYDSLEMLSLLEGVIDIYMPDFKYSSDKSAKSFSGCDDYWKVSTLAIKEMFRQVGPLKLDHDGVAERGLLVRHLVLPNDIAGSYEVLKYLSEKVSKEVYLSLMAQYHPCYKAYTDKKISRRITNDEYNRVLSWAKDFSFCDMYCQQLSSADIFLPDFDKKNPFGNH
ncbi:MAG: radical SAM protein [Spirochaetes bacterium]|nr:MAG: radical SAM protein [Spirochaetota bacterium]